MLNAMYAVSSSVYITQTDDRKTGYVTGGASTQVWSLDSDGTFGERKQEILYVPYNEISTVDRTRVETVWRIME